MLLADERRMSAVVSAGVGNFHQSTSISPLWNDLTMARKNMARRTTRAMLLGLLLAAAPLGMTPLGIAPVGQALADDQTSSARQPTSAPAVIPGGQHNIAVQLKPTGENHNYPVITAMAIDPRGELLAASGDDHVIRILRRSDLVLVSELRGHGDWVQSIDFSPDGSLLVSVANDGQLMTWARDDGWKREVSMRDLPALRSVRFSPTGEMVATVGFSQRLFLMGIGNDKRPTLTCGCRDLRTLDYRGDGLVIAAAGRSGDIFLFNAVTGSTIADVKLHRRRIHEVKFIGTSSKLITASEDGHAIIYDTEKREVLHDLHIPSCQLMSVCVLGEKHLALGGSDNTIRVYNIESGTLVEQLQGHTGTVASLKFIDNVLYSGSFDTTVRRWNLNGVLADAVVAGIYDGQQPSIRSSR